MIFPDFMIPKAFKKKRSDSLERFLIVTNTIIKFNQKIMYKRFCLIVLMSSIIIGSCAQTPFDYKKKWDEVDQLFNKQLPESASKILGEIETQAQSDKNSPQLIAASIYKVKISSQYAENFLVDAINDFEKTIVSSKFPEKNVYYSLTAQLYMQFLSNNYRKISNLSITAEKSDDINTWSRENFLEKAYDYYLKSLDNAAGLQKIKTDEYKAILEKEENPHRILRPTLYDILAFRTLDFLANPENNLLGKSLENTDYLTTYSTFTRLNIPTGTDNYLEESLKLFQDILKFHNNDAAAFIDAELLRLAFVYNNIADFDEKEEKYLEALFALERNYSQHESAADIMFTIANYYSDNALNYNPEISDEYKDYYVKSLAYCKKASEQFPQTNGGKRCYNIMVQIENKEINSIKVAGCNYPNEHFPANISYKNVNDLFVRIIPIDFNDDFLNKSLHTISQSRVNTTSFLSKKAVAEFKLEIPEIGDYRPHNTEIILPPLNSGAYVVIVCNKSTFDRQDDVMAYASFQISKLNSVILDRGEDIEYVVSDRNSGTNLKNCSMSFYSVEGWESNLKYIFVDKKTTNERGKLIVNKNELSKLSGKSSNYTTYFIVISDGKDNFLFKSYFNSNNNRVSEQERTSFFVDRAIYRPGQTVYFKAIAHKGSEETFSVIPNKSMEIALKDNNYKSLSTINIRSNEFGSCNGEFVLPNNCRPGVYTISDRFNSISFRVEEYKRPSFEINFEKVSKQNVANKEVCVKVNAKSLTGISLNNANVKYSINRASYFWYYSSRTVAVSNGTLLLDENGDGTICFTAICPKNKNYYRQPTYTFNIKVDVTDNSGETITANYMVRVSDKSLILTSSSGELVDDEFVVNATSTDGESVDAKINIKIFKLAEPKNLVRKRFWSENPDTFIYSEKEFKDKLPKDAYKDEHSYKNWTKGDLITSINNSDGKINVKDLKLSAGYYVVNASTKDIYGNDVIEDFYFYTFEKEKQHCFSREGISLIASKSPVKPGEKFDIYLSTSSKKANVRLLVFSQKRIIYDDYISVSGTKSFSFEVKEEDRGNIKVIASSILNNRVYNESKNISVPFNNKVLDIKLLTERSFITPNTTEKWSLSIKDYQDKIADAEMLATMYDMSLDYFATDHNSMFNFHHSAKTKYNFSFGSCNSLSSNLAINNYNYKTYSIEGVVYDRFKLNRYSYNSYRGGANDKLKQDSYSYNDGVFEIISHTIPLVSKDRTVASGEIAPNEVYATAEIEEDTAKGDQAVTNEETKKVEQGIRRDFRETTFFYPQLKVNKDGNAEFEFLVPESMTKWKFRAWAHTKDLSTGYYETEIVSKKDIFIQANTPKVLYEKDIIDYSARISNLSSENHSGTAFIEVYDMFGNDITKEVAATKSVNFSIKENSSSYVSWRLSIPNGAGILKIRCGAETSTHTDVEEHIIPVLSTKVLITESLPFTINGKGLNKYTFKSFQEKFDNSKYSTQSMTVEYSANPAWYAIQSLPFLSEGDEIFPLTVFNKLYSNLLAEYIVKNNPEIREVYQQVKTANPETFVSQLAQNQELKNILLSETPWVLDAENEQEQRERMALLFDENKINYTKNAMYEKLERMKHSSGAFTWIENGNYPSYYITLNILTGFANLHSLGIKIDNNFFNSTINPVLKFLDSKITERYDDLVKNKELDKYTISSDVVQYLYARHIFTKEIPVSMEHIRAYDFFMSHLEKNWNIHSLDMQAMMATTLFNTGNKSAANLILKSFNERALRSEELGMYWRDLQKTYTYSSSIVTMAALIECYHKVSGDKKSISEMQRWLLNHKRTNSWQSAPATSKAVFALLLDNSSKIAVKCEDLINIGNVNINTSNATAGAAYIKQNFQATEVTKDFANISIDRKIDGTAWGAAYWQYVADYENVTSTSAGLSVDRKILKSSYNGNIISFTEVNKEDKIDNTDKVVVRMVINSDREYQYVHLKDILPACFIPEQKLSGYSFAGNLLYYTSIKDESINLFIEYLPKGTHVIEYKVNIQQSGSFTGGISKIQCMYAPEFGGQSEGIKINIKR